ncbi:hypothetical protein LXL04_007501 [Taraxacum kok-saghyz]
MFNLFGVHLFSRDEDISNKTSQFFTDQMFKSRDELVEWTQNTAYSLGYVIVTRRSKAYVNGFVYKMLTVICDEHNHPPAQHLEGHPFARRLSADETRFVADLTRKNVTPRNILSILKEQNKNNVSVIKTVYNVQQKIRMDSQAGKTPMQGLTKTNGYPFDTICLKSYTVIILYTMVLLLADSMRLHESLCWNMSPAYEPHYMIMPLTGYLIASKFRVIVHCLSHEQSMTCFPLWKDPEECQPH